MEIRSARGERLRGFSMGAATVLKMSSRCPEQVCFLVADCGYASAEEQLRGSLGHSILPCAPSTA